MITIAITTSFCSCCATERAQSKVETVSEVDLYRYQGRWYEIASYPQWFEKGMTNVSAFYSIKDDYVEVLNSGIKNGVRKETRGKAKVVKGTGNAKLKVTFCWPFSSQYWIVDLDPDYTWVVVSNHKRTTLWIMSRIPVMDEALYYAICRRLEENGFDVGQLVRMKQEIGTVQ